MQPCAKHSPSIRSGCPECMPWLQEQADWHVAVDLRWPKPRIVLNPLRRWPGEQRWVCHDGICSGLGPTPNGAHYAWAHSRNSFDIQGWGG